MRVGFDLFFLRLLMIVEGFLFRVLILLQSHLLGVLVAIQGTLVSGGLPLEVLMCFQLRLLGQLMLVQRSFFSLLMLRQLSMGIGVFLYMVVPLGVLSDLGMT